MDKNVKKGLELGAGITYMAIDAVTAALSKLERDGKISRKESQKAVKDLMAQYDELSKNYAKDVQSKIDEVVRANKKLVTKKDIAYINAQMKKLNALLKKYGQ